MPAPSSRLGSIVRTVTSPPEPPFSGWFIVALLVAGTVYLLVRAAGNQHGWAARVGVVAGSFVALQVPIGAVILTQDLTCRDGGVLERPSGALMVVGLTGLALVWLLTMFWVAGDRAPGSGRRLAVIPPAVLVPVCFVELMGPLLPLEHYCDGARGVLHLQAALALLVPVVSIGLALVRSGPPEAPARVSKPSVLGSAVVVLLAQVAVLTDRLPPAPLACVTRQSLPPVEPGLVAADFDGEGSVDLGGVDRAGVARVLRNDGRGTFTSAAEASVPATFSPSGVVAGDLDGNGQPDLVVVGSERSADRNQRARRGITVLLNDGRSFQAKAPRYFDGDGFGSVALGDLDGDGNVEVVLTQRKAAVVLWDRNGDFEVGPRLAVPAPADADPYGGWSVALGHADGDGRLDVVTWTSRGLDTPAYVVVHRNAGARAFTTSIVATMQDYFSGVAVADFDGDGDVDLVSNGSARRQLVLINRGDGQFDLSTRRTRIWAAHARASDIDGDGLLDLILSVGFVSTEVDEPGFLYVRRGRGNVWFSEPQRLATPHELVAVADLNGDGRADYAVDEFQSAAVLMSRDC